MSENDSLAHVHDYLQSNGWAHLKTYEHDRHIYSGPNRPLINFSAPNKKVPRAYRKKIEEVVERYGKKML